MPQLLHMTSQRLDHPQSLSLCHRIFKLAGPALFSRAALTGGWTNCTRTFSLSGPQSTDVPPPAPSPSREWDLFMVTVYVCTFIFIVVGAVLAYVQIRFRAKSEAEEHAAPPAEAGHGNPLVEIGLIGRLGRSCSSSSLSPPCRTSGIRTMCRRRK